MSQVAKLIANIIVKRRRVKLLANTIIMITTHGVIHWDVKAVVNLCVNIPVNIQVVNMAVSWLVKLTVKRGVK